MTKCGAFFLWKFLDFNSWSSSTITISPMELGFLEATSSLERWYILNYNFIIFDNWLALENNLYTITIPQSFLSFIFVTLGTRQVNCIDEVRCFGLLNAFV